MHHDREWRKRSIPRNPKEAHPYGRFRNMMAARISRLCFVFVALGTAAARPLMKDFIGLNGHTVQFKPELYQPLCSQVRDYHPVAWDLAGDTSEPAPFPSARNKVNWETVYGSWRKHGWNIDACLMFESVPREKWKNPDADARAYGEAFAREFGPSGNRKLVGTVEVGNELFWYVFDGEPEQKDGFIDLADDRPGFGLTLKTPNPAEFTLIT